MALFSFKLHAWAFHDSLSSIEKSYEAAYAALEANIAQARTEIEDYATSLANGAPYEEERDDDGHFVVSKEQILEYHYGEAVSAALVLRKAFVTVLYHHWERNALKWVNSSQMKHHDLVKSVKRLGYPVAKNLDIIYLLCNLLKHNNSKWGQRLAEHRSDLFMFNRRPAEGSKNWENCVVVGDRHIREFIEIVRHSGPETNAMPIPLDRGDPYRDTAD